MAVARAVQSLARQEGEGLGQEATPDVTSTAAQDRILMVAEDRLHVPAVEVILEAVHEVLTADGLVRLSEDAAVVPTTMIVVHTTSQDSVRICGAVEEAPTEISEIIVILEVVGDMIVLHTDRGLSDVEETEIIATLIATETMTDIVDIQEVARTVSKDD